MIVGTLAKASSLTFSETNPALNSAARGYFSGALNLVTPVTVDRFTETAIVQRIHLPHGCSVIEDYASGGNFGNRQYLVGGHTIPIVIDEEFRAHRQSIRPPNVKPVVSVGGGVFVQICYLRYYDEITEERSPLSDGLTVTGNVSRVWTAIPTTVPSEEIQIEGTTTIAAGTCGSGTARFDELRPGDRIAIVGALTQWAQVLTFPNLASITIDDTTLAGVGVAIVAKTVSRVSHVELWVSVDGSLPRFITRVRLGTTSVTESTATLALGEAEVDSFTAIPLGTINVMYNKRQIVAGVEGHEDTLFLSDLEFPERHSGLTFITHYNEPIVGLLRYSDYVIVLCPESSYRLQGFTAGDYTLTVLNAKIGGLGHHGNAVTEVQAFIPSKKGLQIFNGAFHQGISNRRSEWMRNYDAHKLSYERAIGYVNDNDETYQFLPYVMRWGSPTGEEFSWSGTELSNFALPFSRFNMLRQYPAVLVGAYAGVGPQSGGALIEPEWTDDTATTPSDGAPSQYNTHGFVMYAKYIVRTGEKTGRLYRGDNFGRIYLEGQLDDERNPNSLHDDAIFASSHVLVGEYGGDEQTEGKKYIRGWSYLVSEWTAWVLSVFAGDDYARCENPVSQFTDKSTDVAGVVNNGDSAFPLPSPYLFNGVASREVHVGPSINRRSQPVSVHPHSNFHPEARGFTHEYRFTTPRNVRFMGYGLVVGPGSTARPEWFENTAGV